IVGDIALDDCAIKDCASLRHTLAAVRGELSDHIPISLSPLFDFVLPAPRVTDQLHNLVLLEGVPKNLLHLVAGHPVIGTAVCLPKAHHKTMRLGVVRSRDCPPVNGGGVPVV